MGKLLKFLCATKVKKFLHSCTTTMDSGLTCSVLENLVLSGNTVLISMIIVGQFLLLALFFWKIVQVSDRNGILFYACYEKVFSHTIKKCSTDILKNVLV